MTARRWTGDTQDLLAVSAFPRGENFSHGGWGAVFRSLHQNFLHPGEGAGNLRATLPRRTRAPKHTAHEL